MFNNRYTRRRFLKESSLTGLGTVLAVSSASSLLAHCTTVSGEPAVLGGNPLRSKKWPIWPQWNPETDEKRVLEVLRSGVWSRDKVVDEFEKKWAETIGSKRALAVVNGTNALITALVQHDIGAGDEVIVPPYTFIATIQAVLMTGAMPVFVDTDPETFQINADKIEEKITPNTRAILPVHILGLPADMEKIMAIARKHNLVVVEDACQAWLAEINHKKMGTFGHSGCFSFQTTKHIPTGEGGAIVSDDEAFMDKCFSYHNYGYPHGGVIGAVNGGAVIKGTKLRMTEYQAAVGLAMLAKLEMQTERRNENAGYLRSKIKDIPGIVPYRLYPNVTRAAYHMFAFRFRKENFKGLTRDQFIKSLSAEGIPCMSGYAPFLNSQPYLEDAFKSKNYRRMYSAEELDFGKFRQRNQCPENDRLCDETVWLFQSLLLAEKSDMDDIPRAIEKIQNNAQKIRESLKS